MARETISDDTHGVVYEFAPEMDGSDADRMYSRWDDAVERSLDWAQEE